MSEPSSAQSIARLSLVMIIVGALNLFVASMTYGPWIASGAQASTAAVSAQLIAMASVHGVGSVLTIACGVLGRFWLTDARLRTYRVLAIIALVFEVACIPVSIMASGAHFGIVSHIICIFLLGGSVRLASLK